VTTVSGFDELTNQAVNLGCCPECGSDCCGGNCYGDDNGLCLCGAPLNQDGACEEDGCVCQPETLVDQGGLVWSWAECSECGLRCWGTWNEVLDSGCDVRCRGCAEQLQAAGRAWFERALSAEEMPF
jgi:hypothetical protein